MDVLEQAKKVSDEAEVYTISRKETTARFEANRLKQVQARETTGTALRVVKNGRIGFSAATGESGVGDLVARAMEMAPFGAEAKFQFPNPASFPRVDVFDAEVEGVPESAMVHLGQSLIDKVRQHTPELLCEAGVTRIVISVGITNSRGECVTYRKSGFVVGVEGVLIRGTDMLFVGDTEVSSSPVSNADSVVAITLEQLERAGNTAPSISGNLPVIFTPHGVANALLTPLIMATSGKTVLQGASPLANKKGQRVFDPAFTVTDDATIRLRPSSRICDDEGVPSQRNAVVRDGVVEGFLYDLQTAGLAGTVSTGNASRTIGSLPAPSPSALVIHTGGVSFKEMLADIKDGLIVEQLIGASQGNVLGGDFSGNILLGYRVRNGEITGRVKDTMISGNIYDALANIKAVGNESRWVGESVMSPHVYCPSVAVSAKK